MIKCILSILMLTCSSEFVTEQPKPDFSIIDSNILKSADYSDEQIKELELVAVWTKLAEYKKQAEEDFEMPRGDIFLIRRAHEVIKRREPAKNRHKELLPIFHALQAQVDDDLYYRCEEYVKKVLEYYP